jgi:hypothetical protein
MKKLPKSINQASQYNETVEKAYLLILKKTKRLIATLDHDPLRSFLERPLHDATAETIIHELVHPLFYLRLEQRLDDVYTIHFGIEQFSPADDYSDFTAQFIRMVFKYTESEESQMNIEDCVMTDWCITNCSEMYEYIVERNKHHTLITLPYKKRTPQGKRVLAVV